MKPKSNLPKMFSPIKVSMALALFLSCGLLFSQTKDPGLSEKEIQSRPVRFINRSSRAATNTVRRRQVRTGRGLARNVKRNRRADSRNFNVQRVYDSKVNLLGGDIISLKRRSRFTHINNIRRFLTGYLMDAFDYNQQDAQVLSTFVLYYNARKRGQIEDFRGRYSPAVLDLLNPQSVGIDRSYRRWAGRTQLVLPLRKSAARPGGDISNSEIRKSAGKLSPSQKKRLDDIQRRRAQEDLKRLEKEEKKVKKEEKKVKEEKKKVAEEKKKVVEDKKKTEEKIKKLKKDPEKNKKEIKKEEDKKKKIEKKEVEIKKKEEVIKKKEEVITKKKEEIKKEKKEVKKTIEDPGKTEPGKTTDPDKKEPGKTEPGKTEPGKTTDPDKKDPTKEEIKKKVVEDIKKEITKEIKKKKEEKSDNVLVDKILFLRVKRYFNEGHYNNELWAIDAAKEDTIFRSPFSHICGRKFIIVPDQGVLVIGYESDGHPKSGHFLYLLDDKKLSQKAKSTLSIFWRSRLILRDDKIYAFELKDGEYYIARFNYDLTLDKRSDKPVSPDSDITFYKKKIYLTGKTQSGQATTIRIFNRGDLTHKKTITPPK